MRKGYVLVQYSDGIGDLEHDALHTRGCKMKVFRRRVDMKELYENAPWILCPFGGGDEACAYMRCRIEKWPERYSSWNLSEQQISEAKSIEPKQERSRWEITL